MDQNEQNFDIWLIRPRVLTRQAPDWLDPPKTVLATPRRCNSARA